MNPQQQQNDSAIAAAAAANVTVIPATIPVIAPIGKPPPLYDVNYDLGWHLPRFYQVYSINIIFTVSILVSSKNRSQ